MPTFQPSQWSETTGSAAPRAIPSYSMQSNAAGEVIDEMMESLPGTSALPSVDPERKKKMIGGVILVSAFLGLAVWYSRRKKKGEEADEEEGDKSRDQTEATVEAASEDWTGSMD